VDLGFDERTKTLSIESCGIWISDHEFVANCVMKKMVALIHLQVIVVDERLMAFVNEVIVGEYRDRQNHMAPKN
jgi:hypothetical protein